MKSRMLMMVLVTAAVVLVSWLLNSGIVSLFVPIAMYLAMAQGWNLLGGYGGYLNLGMASFFGLGAFGAAIAAVNWNQSLPVALLVGAVVAILGGLVMGLLSLRLRGAFFAIFTFVSVFVLEAIANTVGITHGALGITLPTFSSLSYNTLTKIWFDAFIVLGLLATVVVWLVERSRWGSSLVAIKEDEPAAEVLGIRTMRVKLLAFLFAALVGGLAGGLYAYQQQFIYPSTIFTDTVTLQVVLMAVAGGGGSWLGPVIGTPLVMGISALMRLIVGSVVVFGNGIPAQLELIIYGLMLVAVGMFLPNGLVGLVKRWRGRSATPAATSERLEARGA
ncbi:MAG: branched-chain amino acid ABC transporter permease [Firmicutes bacterium]|nr:branched-chain amino acid ABC transporter permease [Bacillota bacterium]